MRESPPERLALVLLAAAFLLLFFGAELTPIPCTGLWGRDVGMEPKHMSHPLFQESLKIPQHWRESEPKGTLTYHQYMPPEPRQGSRADPQAKGSALGPPGPLLWEETDSQQPPPGYGLRFCSPGSLSPQNPPLSNPESKIRGVWPLVLYSPRSQGSVSPGRPSVPRSPSLTP